MSYLMKRCRTLKSAKRAQTCQSIGLGCFASYPPPPCIKLIYKKNFHKSVLLIHIL